MTHLNIYNKILDRNYIPNRTACCLLLLIFMCLTFNLEKNSEKLSLLRYIWILLSLFFLLFNNFHLMKYLLLSTHTQLNSIKDTDNNIHRSSAPSNRLKTIYTNTNTSHFHSSNHQKWLSYKILGWNHVKNVHINPQTTEIW